MNAIRQWLVFTLISFASVGTSSAAWLPLPFSGISPIDDPTLQVSAEGVVSTSDRVVVIGRAGRLDPPSADDVNPKENPIFHDRSQYRAWARAFDLSGRKIWERIYDGPQQLLPNAIAAFADGFVVVGDQQKTEKREFTGWLSRLDSEGREVWRREVGPPGVTGLQTVAVDDGRLIAAGGGREYKGWLVAFGSDGRTLWEKTFPEVRNITAVMFRGDRLIVVGVETNTASLGTSRLIALDRSGTVLWATNLGLGEAEALVPTADGGVVVGMGQALHQLISSAWIVRFQANGGVISSRLLDSSNGSTHGQAARAVTVLPEGDLIVAGHEFDPGRQQTSAKLWRLSPKGVLKRERTYEASESYNHVAAIARGPKNQLTAVGLSNSLQYKTTHPLILRLEGETLSEVRDWAKILP